jgi:hypothetical protein
MLTSDYLIVAVVELWDGGAHAPPLRPPVVILRLRRWGLQVTARRQRQRSTRRTIVVLGGNTARRKTAAGTTPAAPCAADLVRPVPTGTLPTHTRPRIHTPLGAPPVLLRQGARAAFRARRAQHRTRAPTASPRAPVECRATCSARRLGSLRPALWFPAPSRRAARAITTCALRTMWLLLGILPRRRYDVPLGGDGARGARAA